MAPEHERELDEPADPRGRSRHVEDVDEHLDPRPPRVERVAGERRCRQEQEAAGPGSRGRAGVDGRERGRRHANGGHEGRHAHRQAEAARQRRVVPEQTRPPEEGEQEAGEEHALATETDDEPEERSAARDEDARDEQPAGDHVGRRRPVPGGE